MRASTGGPLAAFLMVAPLVAIPVFAVVGIPQFAPAVSSAVGDDEPSDPGLPQVGLGKPAAAPAKPTVPARGAEDLFAPVGTPRSQNSAKPVVASRPGSETSPAADPRSGALSRNGAKGDGRSLQDPVEWITPAEALDGWALAPESEKPNRNALKETVKPVLRQPSQPLDNDLTLDDLPPEAPPAAKPKIRSGRPPVDDGWEPERTEPAAPAIRKPMTRSIPPKKKRPVAPSDSGLNFANVPESQDDPAAARPATPRSLSNTPVPKVSPTEGMAEIDGKAEIKTVSATNEKISLTKFTPGLVHPLDEGDSPAAATGSQPVRSPSTKKGSQPRKPLGGRPATTTDPDETITWEAATQRLKELGISQYKLEALPEGRFQFSCQLTPANNPTVRRKFEDSSDEPLLAVQKVLRQIDEWQSQR